MTRRATKDLTITPGKFKMDTEDLLAIAGLLVGVIIALGIVFAGIDVKLGGGILIALCGGSAIAEVIGARRRFNAKPVGRRAQKDITVGPDGSMSIAAEDILALAGLFVALIIAIGMVFAGFDAKIGSGVLVAICGGTAIASVIGARRRSRATS